MTTLKILGIDDEQGMRLGIERALEAFVIDIPDIREQVDFKVALAETGEEAVRLIKENPPDILLLDYKLPGINGLEVLDQTAENNTDMLTIMITAYASIETAVAATKQGAYDFLPKPFTPSDLKHTVRKAATRIMLARKARDLEAEKKRVRFEFIRVLGHELKAPLSSISSYLYIFRDHVLGDNVCEYDEMIERCFLRLDQMRKLIVDLLDMTRLESGQRNRNIAEIALRQAAIDAIELVKGQAEKRNITIDLVCEESTGINGDRQELDMILNNLLSNAVKYNRVDGGVNVNIHRSADNIIIKVADTGLGMSDDEKKKLFGEFVRIRNSKTREILGSGLGLSILKRLAELYNGRIDVDSEPDKGSTFTVTLSDAEKRTEPDE